MKKFFRKYFKIIILLLLILLIISVSYTHLGGMVISEELGTKMENATLDMLGSARQVKITKDNTTIIDGNGDKDEIAARVTQIKRQYDESTSEFDKEKLQELSLIHI